MYLGATTSFKIYTGGGYVMTCSITGMGTVAFTN
jgi:hypothetical protein